MISLKRVAREAIKAASAGALSILGATWKAPRRRENGQTGERPGQKEKGTVPGNQQQGEQEGNDGDDSIEKQRGKLSKEGPRTPLQEHKGQQRDETLRERQVEAMKKPRIEQNGTTRQKKGNRKPSGASIRRYTSLPQGVWSRLQREAGNLFNVLKAANTAKRHTAGTQTLEKGHTGLGPAPRTQEAQGGRLRAAAGGGQGRAGLSPDRKERDNRGNSKLSFPPTISNTHKAHQSPRSRSPMQHSHQQQDPGSPPTHV